MKFSKPCVVALAAALCPILTLGVAGADTTLYGPTGLILNPTAEIAPVGMTEGTIYWFNQDDTANGGQDIDWLTFGVVGGMKPNAEFNIGYNRLDINQPAAMAGVSPDGLIAGVKFRLAEESETLPALALGLHRFDANGWYQRTSVYACATKDLSVPQEHNLGLRGTVGLRWSDADLVVPGGTRSGGEVIPFVGVEARIAPKLNLILELEKEQKFGGGVSTNTPFTAVLRYRPTDNLVVHGGVVNTGFDERNSLAVGVSYIWENTGWR